MKRKKLPADRALEAKKASGKPPWRASALALATAVLIGVCPTDANAFALGPVTVQSALGEPLRAQIDIPDINAEELASLKAAVATPESFRAAGLEYNAALSGMRITLERRPDGRYFLGLSSPRAINEPFLDLILETSWSSGRVVRDYTLLFDPPNLRQSAPPVTAQVSPVAPATRVNPASPAPSPAPAPAPAQRAAAAPATGSATPSSGQPSSSQAAGDGKQVTVRGGDTAGRIAAANKPANVSLDQMLVALLRANPDAFIEGNVNRLKAGAVLQIPGAAQVEQTGADDARQTIVAQSRDFNDFRRKLAEGVPTTRIAPAERQASGKVEAKVEDRKPGAAAPDKLTLSKGAVQGKASADQIARDRAKQDATTRLAELNKNIADLNKLGTTTAPSAAAPAVASSAPKPGITVPVPVATASAAKPATPAATPATPAPVTAAATPAPAPTAPATVAAASAPAPVAAPAVPVTAAASSAPAGAAPAMSASSAPTADPVSAAASAPLASASAVTAAAKPAASAAAKPKAAPPTETTLIEDLMENPIVPATLGGVLALLLGFGFYRAQQRKKSAQVDSSFLESRLQPDSFFGASGGQRIDTNEGGATGSSMVYSPSQLDAAGDVDPVAEADVYLAYGRDLQAEEILKEAMRTTPQRVAIHAKLLEIYSKRRDSKAFEMVAGEAYGLTRGQGPEWDHICELGQELDPNNPLYRPGGQPASAAGGAAMATAAFGATAAQTLPMSAAPAADVDLDLDFSLCDEEPAAAPAAAARAAAQPAAAPMAPPMPSLDMDFGSATVALGSGAPAAAPNAPRAPAASAPAASPDIDVPDLVLDEPAAPPAAASAPAASAPAAGPGMIEFDLGALSLDLDSPAKGTTDESPSKSGEVSTGGFEASGGDGSDPLATKLALAEEFNAIGDPDGARSLAQEVLAEASGDLKNRAQRFLAEIS
jgi:pilus assembly protein FimV